MTNTSILETEAETIVLNSTAGRLTCSLHFGYLETVLLQNERNLGSGARGVALETPVWPLTQVTARRGWAAGPALTGRRLRPWDVSPPHTDSIGDARRA